MTLNVTAAPSFTVALSPDSLRIVAGTSGTTTLTLTPQNNFTGSVSLALIDAQGNAPQGIALSPTSLNVSGTNPVSQSLTIAVASSTNPATYRLRLRATSGSLVREANLTITVVTTPSSGGATWTQRVFEPLTLNDVAWGNGLFVAVGDDGTLATSSDGVRWTTGSGNPSRS